MSAPNNENRSLPDGVVVQQSPTGARVLQFAEDVQVGVAPDDRVTSATPAGWDLVLESGLFTEQTYRIPGDQPDGPATHGSEFYAPGE